MYFYAMKQAWLFFLVVLYFTTAFRLRAQEYMPYRRDTAEVRRLNQMGAEAMLEEAGWMSALHYLGQGYRLAEEIGFEEGKADALRLIARVEESLGDRKEALQYYLREIDIRKNLGQTEEIAQTYLYLGDFFYKREDLKAQALGYYVQALFLGEKLDWSNQQRLEVLEKIAQLAQENQAPSYLLETYQKMLPLLAAEQNYIQAKKTALEIVQLYLDKQAFASSLHYAKMAQDYEKKIGNISRAEQQRLQMLIRDISRAQSQAREEKIDYGLIAVLGLILLGMLSWGSYWWLYRRREQKSD